MQDSGEQGAARASREGRQILPMPAARAPLSLDCIYTDAEFATLRAGRIPREMEDRWFVVYNAPWFYVHRCGSGVCVYQVRFEPVSGGQQVAEALVNRDPSQYNSTAEFPDALLATCILDRAAGRDGAEATKVFMAALGLPAPALHVDEEWSTRELVVNTLTGLLLLFVGVVVGAVFLNIYYAVCTFFSVTLLGIENGTFHQFEYFVCLVAAFLSSFVLMWCVWPGSPGNKQPSTGDRP